MPQHRKLCLFPFCFQGYECLTAKQQILCERCTVQLLKFSLCFSWRCGFQQQQKSCSGKPVLKRVCIGVGDLERQQHLQWFRKQHRNVWDYMEYHLSERIQRWVSVKPSSEKLRWRSPIQRPGGIRLIFFSLNALALWKLGSSWQTQNWECDPWGLETKLHFVQAHYWNGLLFFA